MLELEKVEVAVLVTTEKPDLVVTWITVDLGD